MNAQPRTIVSDPEILGGTPVFAGSRVPFAHLIQYIERGSNPDQFVEDYPSVTAELAARALEEATLLFEDAVHARPA